MSCGPSCGTTTCGTCDPDSPLNALKLSSVEDLLQFARSNWTVSKHNNDWDRFFNALALAIAKDNAQALKPLLAVFEEHGPELFLEFSKDLIKLKLLGHPIWWAFEFCSQDTSKLLVEVKSPTDEMVEFVNKKIDFHACFAGNEKYRKLLKRKVTHSNVSQPSQSMSNEVKEFVQQFLVLFVIGAILLHVKAFFEL